MLPILHLDLITINLICFWFKGQKTVTTMKHINCSHCRKGHIENKKAFQYDAYRLLSTVSLCIPCPGGEIPLDIPTSTLDIPTPPFDILTSPRKGPGTRDTPRKDMVPWYPPLWTGRQVIWRYAMYACENITFSQAVNIRQLVQPLLLNNNHAALKLYTPR